MPISPQALKRSLLTAVLLAATVVVSPGTLSPPLFPNEGIYISQLFYSSGLKEYAGDWTLRNLTSDRPLFNLVFWILGRTGDPAVVSLVGRPLAWSAIFASVMLMMRQLGVRSPVLQAFVVFVWIAPFPYTLNQEWMIGAFESKSFAYGAIFMMLACLMGRNLWAAAMLCGVAAGMHNLLGMWGLAIFFVAAWVCGAERRSLFGPFMLATLLVGVMSYPALRTTVLAPADDADTLHTFTHILWGYHYDPTQFPRVRMLGFALVFLGELILVSSRFGRKHWGRDTAWRVLLAAECVTAAAFLVGFVVYATNIDLLLFLMPMRLAPVIIPLAAISRIAFIVSQQPSLSPRVLLSRLQTTAPAGLSARLVPVVGLSIVLAGLLATPVHGAGYRVSLLEFQRHPAVTDEDRAFAWARKSLPAEAVVAVDPSRASFSAVRRPLVAVYLAAPTTRLGEWEQRMLDLTGVDLRLLKAGDPQSGLVLLSERLTAGFHARPIESVIQWRTRWGATHVITRATYPLPVLATFGEFSAYEIEVPKTEVEWSQFRR